MPRCIAQEAPRDSLWAICRVQSFSCDSKVEGLVGSHVDETESGFIELTEQRVETNKIVRDQNGETGMKGTGDKKNISD